MNMVYYGRGWENRMTFKWKPTRPLAVFDIEATGANHRADRIVELAIVRILPSGERESFTFRVNPQMPIPPEATEIHGITNEDVAACPTFLQIAGQVAEAFADCDLAGYNVTRFDIPLLIAEFQRSNLIFDLSGRRIIDAQRIFHRREPRDLTAALSFFCNETHFDAHGAAADTLATIRVLEGEFERYPDLPKNPAALHEYCNPRDPSWVDQTGRLKWADGEVVINFGKKAGQLLRALVENEKSFLNWMLKSDFPADTKEIVCNALEGNYPLPSQTALPTAPDETLGYLEK